MRGKTTLQGFQEHQPFASVFDVRAHAREEDRRDRLPRQPSSGKLFTQDDVRFVEAFADHGAMLENVRRRAELESRTAAKAVVVNGRVTARSSAAHPR
jgi:hypothetical protein